MSEAFHEYHIQGMIAQDFNLSWTHKLGLACAAFFKENGYQRIVLAQDSGTTSSTLALIQGLSAGGIDVISLGVVPLSCLHFGIKHLNLEAGIMVAACENSGGHCIDKNVLSVFLDSSVSGKKELEKITSLMENELVPASSYGFFSQCNILSAYEGRTVS